MFAKRTTSTLGDIMFGAGKAPKLDAKQILKLLRIQLKKKCEEEFTKWGKCNELLTNDDMDKKKEEMAQQLEEVPIDSRKYNKILLHRA